MLRLSIEITLGILQECPNRLDILLVYFEYIHHVVHIFVWIDLREE